MRKRDVISVLCSDIHLSHKPPVARSAEPIWYEAMARPIREMKKVAEKLEVPIVCAGDIFDRWNSPPELINFAIRELPHMFAIPGQHDLPNHSLEEVHRSAFWTLEEANTINVGDGYSEYVLDRDSGLVVHLFPWGDEIRPLKLKKEPGEFHLAVIHQYCWIGQFKYPTAPKEQNLVRLRDKLQGYDAAVFGDNHKGFVKGSVCNCGGLMRRNIDQVGYKPFIGILRRDGSIEQYFLDVSKDKFIDVKETEETESIDLTDFVEELKTLGPDSLDFRAAIDHYISSEDVDKDVKSQMIQILDEEQNGN